MEPITHEQIYERLLSVETKVDGIHKEIEEDTVSESVKSQSAWTLVCWLGEYQKTID